MVDRIVTYDHMVDMGLQSKKTKGERNELQKQATPTKTKKTKTKQKTKKSQQKFWMILRESKDIITSLPHTVALHPQILLRDEKSKTHFFLYSFIHMCIHCLGHFCPHPPHFQAEPVLPSSPILLKRRHKAIIRKA
jgi:hypothetical protein